MTKIIMATCVLVLFQLALLYYKLGITLSVSYNITDISWWIVLIPMFILILGVIAIFLLLSNLNM